MIVIFKKNIKITIVTPIYKGKYSDPHEFANYRPISLLPTLSKIFKKIRNSVYEYIYINNNDLLNNSLNDFRPYRATEY